MKSHKCTSEFPSLCHDCECPIGRDHTGHEHSWARFLAGEPADQLRL